ncbi:MAG: AAA family ATPase, partial [Candidatus Binatia bacterium]
MIPSLELLRRHAVLSALDEHFARTLGRIGGETNEAVILAAALAASRVGESHVCLDLAEVAGRSPEAPEAEAPLADYAFPALAEWRELLDKSSLVSADGAPLVLDGTRLYLRRYHRYETELARQIRRRASEPALDVDQESLGRSLRRLFPESGRGPSWQRVAAAVGLLRRFTVIAGGPGTGKTWTAARIVALLVEQGLGRGVRPRIHLLAPTGKAAARLRESIRESRDSLDCPEA